MLNPWATSRMVKAFFSTITVFLLAAKTTSPPYTSFDARSGQGEPGGVYFCNEPDFTGRCWWTAAGLFPPTCELATDEFDSFGPDAGAICAIYDQTSCGGNAVLAASPGIFNLNAMGWGYPRPKSYMCWVFGSKKDVEGKETKKEKFES